MSYLNLYCIKMYIQRCRIHRCREEWHTAVARKEKNVAARLSSILFFNKLFHHASAIWGSNIKTTVFPTSAFKIYDLSCDVASNALLLHRWPTPAGTEVPQWQADQVRPTREVFLPRGKRAYSRVQSGVRDRRIWQGCRRDNWPRSSKEVIWDEIVTKRERK